MISTTDIGSTIIVRKNDDNQSYSKKRLADAINEVIATIELNEPNAVITSGINQRYFQEKAGRY
jgi:hypothetical protein